MDTLDQQLIAELRINGRASVPQLAQLLGVARATAQKRLDRLIANGDIKGFSVRLRDEVGENMIRAIMLVEFAKSPVKNAIAAIKRMPGIADLFNTNGTWDMITMVEVATMAEMNKLVTDVRGLEGVIKSETFIILGPA